MYDISLENTLNIMKKITAFFKIEERDKGNIFWNAYPTEIIGGKKLKINENIYDKTPGIQKVLTDTSNMPLKEKDSEIFMNILDSLDFKNYKAIRGDSKSGRYKQSETNFEKKVIWKIKELKNFLYHPI